MWSLTKQILARVGDDADVVSEPLAELGRRLWSAAGGGTRELPPGTVAAFALLHWRRHLLLPLESDTNDLATAMLFWEAISEHAPPRVRALLAEEHPDPLRRLKRADEVLREALESDDPHVAHLAVDLLRCGPLDARRYLEYHAVARWELSTY